VTAEGEGNAVLSALREEGGVMGESDDGDGGGKVIEGEGKASAAGTRIVEANDREAVGVSADDERLIAKKDRAAFLDMIEEALTMSAVVVVTGGDNDAIGGVDGRKEGFDVAKIGVAAADKVTGNEDEIRLLAIDERGPAIEQSFLGEGADVQVSDVHDAIVVESGAEAFD